MSPLLLETEVPTKSGERAHNIGGTTPCSISEISEQQRLKNKNEEPVAPNEDE